MTSTSSTKSNAPTPRLVPEKITLVDCIALHSSQEWQSSQAGRREVLVVPPPPPASRSKTRETTLRVLREFMAQLDDFSEFDEQQDGPARDHE